MKLNYIEPHEAEYDPLRSITSGRNIFNQLVVWEVTLVNGSIVLSNGYGAEYILADYDKPIRSISAAFLRFSIPYIAIEYVDGSTVIYKVDVETAEMKSLNHDLSKFKSVSLYYSKAISTTDLSIAAVGDDGVYRGTINDNSFQLVKVLKLSDSEKYRIGRFALNVQNELAIELIEYS